MTDPPLEQISLRDKQPVSRALVQEGGGGLKLEPRRCHLLAETLGKSVFLPSFSFWPARRCPYHRAVMETQQNQACLEQSPVPGTEWAHGKPELLLF